MEYKCLAVQQPFASGIVEGIKKIEIRSWKTEYRGPLAIYACKRPVITLEDGEILPTGCIIGIVDLVDCRPLCPDDANAAVTTKREIQKMLKQKTYYAWILENARTLAQPIPAKGRLGLFTIHL